MRFCGIHLRAISECAQANSLYTNFESYFKIIATSPKDQRVKYGSWVTYFVTKMNDLSYLLRLQRKPDATTPIHGILQMWNNMKLIMLSLYFLVYWKHVSKAISNSTFTDVINITKNTDTSQLLGKYILSENQNAKISKHGWHGHGGFITMTS